MTVILVSFCMIVSCSYGRTLSTCYNSLDRQIVKVDDEIIETFFLLL